MKHVRTFESMNREPQVGDYVLCVETSKSIFEPSELATFIDNNVGQISKIIDDEDRSYPYHVKYENIPFRITENFAIDVRAFSRNDIIFFSPVKLDVEQMINVNKYNI